jgi:hypothetical protein
VWFPVHERTTATSIGSGFNLLGIAISFIIGCLFYAQSRIVLRSAITYKYDLYRATSCDLGQWLLL